MAYICTRMLSYVLEVFRFQQLSGKRDTKLKTIWRSVKMNVTFKQYLTFFFSPPFYLKVMKSIFCRKQNRILYKLNK